MQQLFQPHTLALVFWITITGWVVINLWVGQHHKLQQRNKIGRRSDSLVFFGHEAVLVIAFALKLLLPNAKLYGSPALFWLGIVLIWGGTVLRQLAIKTLGKYHVMTIATQDKQPVITSGVYRYIRHPSYLGAIVSVVGVALSLNSLVGSIGLIALTIAVLVHRILIEDAYLGEHLGKAYRDYAKRTSRLIPHLW
jgi:protein-S-isoprenylcysteine O-methyltransferase